MTTVLRAGRSLVTARAIADVVRAAALTSYGVVDLAVGPFERVTGRLGFATPGVHVSVRGGIAVRLDLVVAYGLPVAEVARQVESAVRYALRTALDREPDALSIHVEGLRREGGHSRMARAEATPSAPSAPFVPVAPVETSGSSRRVH